MGEVTAACSAEAASQAAAALAGGGVSACGKIGLAGAVGVSRLYGEANSLACSLARRACSVIEVPRSLGTRNLLKKRDSATWAGGDGGPGRAGGPEAGELASASAVSGSWHGGVW